MNDMTWLYLGYAVPAFLIPVAYGSWKCTLYHLLVGPGLASLLTNNINEWPAIWCLTSIGLLLIAVKSPVRARLYTHQWFWWAWGQTDPPSVASCRQQPPGPEFQALSCGEAEPALTLPPLHPVLYRWAGMDPGWGHS